MTMLTLVGKIRVVNPDGSSWLMHVSTEILPFEEGETLGDILDRATTLPRVVDLGVSSIQCECPGPVGLDYEPSDDDQIVITPVP